VACWFVILYAGLRIPLDLLRDYPISFLWLPAGQSFNVLMLAAGLALLVKNIYWPSAAAPFTGTPEPADHGRPHPATRIAFAALVVLALTIPSDATRDIPARYGERHAGLSYSWLYPPIGVEPQAAEAARHANKE
jgi:hypothetical protein